MALHGCSLHRRLGVIQLCGFVLSMKTGTNLKLITLLLQHNTFNSQSLTSFAPSGLGLARVMVYIMMLPVKTINQLQKKKKQTVLKKKKKKRKNEGCNRDYSLVLEADNSQGSCKLTLHNYQANNIFQLQGFHLQVMQMKTSS